MMGTPRQRNRPGPASRWRGGWKQIGPGVVTPKDSPPSPDHEIRVHGVHVRISWDRGGVHAWAKDDRLRQSEWMTDERKLELVNDAGGWVREMQELERRLIARLRQIGRN